MPTPESLTALLAQYAGDRIGVTAVQETLNRVENYMSEIDDKLTELKNKVDAMTSAQAESFANLRTALQEFAEAKGKFTVDQEAKFAALVEAVDAAAVNATAGDDGYEPTQSGDPNQPTEPQPGEPGTTPTGEPIPNAPVA